MVKLLRRLARFCILVACAAGIVGLYLLKPFMRIRFGGIFSNRIGHLAANIDLHLRRRQLGGIDPRAMYLFFPLAPPCNRQLFEMIRRELSVIENPVLVRLFSHCQSLLKHTEFLEPLPFHHNEYREFKEARATLAFTSEEEERGRRGLARLGIGESDWLVCFHNRDSVFLAREIPGQDWEYHNYRDTSVTNFLDAAKYIVEQGGFAVRLGAIVLEPIPRGTHHPRIPPATASCSR